MIQIRSICLSAHLDSLCRALYKVSGERFEFVYTDADLSEMRLKIGWRTDADYPSHLDNDESYARAVTCDLLIEMLRELPLMELRAQKGLQTVYVSERWFKPIPIGGRFRSLGRLVGLGGMRLPGVLRLLVPSYRRMAKRFVRLMDDPNIWFFPCGVHAVRDFVRMYKILHGNLLAWFRTPKVNITRELGGDVEGFPRMKLWGYFVEPSSKLPKPTKPTKPSRRLRVLWVGRMLDWKRVDVLIKAFKRVKKVRPIALVLCGEGPERQRLEQLAGDDGSTGLSWQEGKICFNDYVLSTKVRELMREADVYVMPSNAEEGWGAAVSDALTEGCPVLSTFEAGASATLLPTTHLYHAKSTAELATLLLRPVLPVDNVARNWGASRGADFLMKVWARK